MYKLVLAASLVLAPFAAAATIQSQGEGDGYSPEKGLDLSASFEAQRAAILKALGDGKTYAEISAADRHRVTDALEQISGLLHGAQSVEQLPEQARVQVFNQQELVNTVLTQAHEDSRLVCTREKKVGSHRATNNCMTVAERRRAREQTHDQLGNMRRIQMPAAN